MGGIRFKGFLLHQEVKAILENVWASIHDQPAPGPKIPLQTQIKNLQDFIKKREENQNLLRLQIKRLERYSSEFPSDKQSSDLQIADANRTIGELYSQITKAKKELEKISSGAATPQQSGDWTKYDDKKARGIFGDISKNLKTGAFGRDEETGEVITKSDPRWEKYYIVRGNKR